MDNPEFEKLLESITDDINKTLKSNLGSYFKTIDNNNKVIDVLKSLLFTMPEYLKLKSDYEQLQDEYLTLKTAYDYLKSSNVKNIKMHISETFTTPSETTIIKNTETTQNEIIDPSTLSSNDEDEEDDEEDEENNEHEDDEEQDEVEVETEKVKETKETQEEEEEDGEEEVEVEGEEDEETEDEEAEDEDEDEDEEAEEEEGEEEEDGEEEEVEEDEDEVEIITIGSKKYYVNQETKDVYEFLKNEDIGDFIGKLENNKLVKKKV